MYEYKNDKAIMIKYFAYVELVISIILAFIIGYDGYYSYFAWEIIFGISTLGVSLCVILIGVSEAIQIAFENSHKIRQIEIDIKNKK